MLAALGFGYFPADYVTILIVVGCIGAAAMGWLTDMLMRDAGVGIIGNSLVALGGMALTLLVWNRYVGPVTVAEPLVVITAMAAAIVALLMAIALLKQLR
jgi:hypothetical protein